jgi:polyhydroxyalkanoate synthesis regulator phasin
MDENQPDENEDETDSNDTGEGQTPDQDRNPGIDHPTATIETDSVEAMHLAEDASTPTASQLTGELRQSSTEVLHAATQSVAQVSILIDLIDNDADLSNAEARYVYEQLLDRHEALKERAAWTESVIEDLGDVVEAENKKANSTDESATERTERGNET